MRIATTEYKDIALTGIYSAYQQMGQASTELSTGHRISQPSDDPTGTAQALTIQNHIDSLNQSANQLNSAKSYLSATDTALSSVSGVLQQAQTIAVQGASGTLSASDRATLAQQVNGLIQTLANTGNSMYGNRYIFAGQRNDKPPFVQNASGGYTYQGGTAATNDGNINLAISPQNTLTINTTGDVAIAPAINALTQLAANLNSGDQNAISNQSITAINTEITNLSTTRADVGSKVNNVTAALTQNSAIALNFTQSLSDIEDTDVPKTVVQYQSAQLAYQSALQSTAQIGQLSLLDYLK